jgi:hypothetical protein
LKSSAFYSVLAAVLCGFLCFPTVRGAAQPAVAAPSESPMIVAGQHNWLDTTPVRGLQKPLSLDRTGFTYQCSECHKDFKTPVRSNNPVGEHSHIKLNHGEDMGCLACHHPGIRGSYVDHEGREIPQDKPVLLCAKCHGTIYRDWKQGVHGRMNGFWDIRQGPATKLVCSQCHDPHQPVFKALVPMPPPVSADPAHVKKGARHE